MLRVGDKVFVFEEEFEEFGFPEDGGGPAVFGVVINNHLLFSRVWMPIGTEILKDPAVLSIDEVRDPSGDESGIVVSAIVLVSEGFEIGD
jgi:hypothetical protein